MLRQITRLGSFCLLAAACSTSTTSGGGPSEPATGPEPSYEPCAQKQCGEPCSLCPPGEADCHEPTGIKACDGQGVCVETPVECAGDLPPPVDAPAGYAPCSGKRCGEPCSLCPPHEPSCVETAVVKECDAAGRCAAAPAECPLDQRAPSEPQRSEDTTP